jgi:hypothetical protein
LRHGVLIGALTLAGNWVDCKISPWAALPGLLILLAMVMVGLVLTRLIPLFRQACNGADVGRDRALQEPREAMRTQQGQPHAGKDR